MTPWKRDEKEEVKIEPYFYIGDIKCRTVIEMLYGKRFKTYGEYSDYYHTALANSGKVCTCLDCKIRSK